jgi:Arc/MetJ-type ribon-helix-helix transcriptional regulator
MEVDILNVRLPREITDWLDSLVKRGVYKSRSEAVRDFVRDYVGERGGKE